MGSFLKKLKLKDIMFSLILLVVVTSLAVVNLAAKYRTKSSDGEESRIAKFDITEEGVTTLDISGEGFYPGYQITEQLQIHNKSEVAINYSVSVTTIGVLPLEIEIDGVIGNPLNFTKYLLPNGENQTYDIIVRWPAELNDPRYSGMVDLVKITVSATQAD